jgi:hypothetical protein
LSTEPGLPAEVITLLHRALPSMVHIESLLMLARLAPEPATRWDIAAELRSSPALVAGALADLEGHRLVEPVAGTGGEQHRFVGSDPAVVQAVASLRDVYDRKPVTLIRAMYERPAPPQAPSAAQAFADAFRVRPPDDR